MKAARALQVIALLALACAVMGGGGAEPQAPRPPAEDAEPRARAIFDAIVHDEPARAADAFFPRAAFLLVKAMQDPGRYYDRLRARFDADIHALHAAIPGVESAAFERFELAKRGGYVQPGEEGNKLPYWASRHSWLHYKLGERAGKLEVRVMITWQDHWYAIHLSEFR